MTSRFSDIDKVKVPDIIEVLEPCFDLENEIIDISMSPTDERLGLYDHLAGRISVLYDLRIALKQQEKPDGRTTGSRSTRASGARPRRSG